MDATPRIRRRTAPSIWGALLIIAALLIVLAIRASMRMSRLRIRDDPNGY